MKISKLAKPFINYNREVTEKKYICLHTTGGHGAMNTINYWATRYDGKGTISTPYIIDRNGVIIQTYSPQYWSHHTGKGKAIDKQTIGIELENVGVCKINDNNELFNADKVKPIDYISWMDEDQIQHYHEKITTNQWKSLLLLIDTLTAFYNIKQVMATDEDITLSENDYFGIFTHRQINDNKTDIPKEVFEDYSIMESFPYINKK